MADNPLMVPVRQVLDARGFKKKGPYGIYRKPLSPGVHAWVGMNARSDPGSLTLSPTVGVRHEEVERWVSLLRDRNPKDSTAPTVSTGLMNLLPEGRAWPHWVLARGEDQQNAQTWELFGQDIDQYAMPWMQERDTGERLVEPLRRNEGLDTSRLALPVLLWILGDPAGAREAVERGRSAKIVGGMVVDYGAYAERLLAEIDAHPDGPVE
ncbi:hypothetical protein SAMN04487968_1084 [Nocardioides terrae]|uniref:Uncharacterized protein n=1 Tax=Nocardioides terrae TaxID=574651 RepID=A0A1I1K596_9ACTN|nr:hypothetical protein [Nocardioides terrae]SFC56137.1 hypothetical protein SAMN04487968_1084 [Nocardioides terrae]